MLSQGALKTWSWLHKWSSLVCTVFMLLLCLTGLPLIFHHEIDHALGEEIEAPAINGGAAFQLAPYVSRQKEIGVKYDAGRIGFDAALFTTNKPRPVQSTTVAQGYDRHTGLELNVFGEATRDLKILGGLTLLDTTQHDTGSALTEGKRTLGAAKTLANLGLEWSVPSVDGLALDGRVVYTGGVYADSANTLAVPSWTRFDLGARYNFEVQRTLMTARLRIENAADRKYWASAGGYPEQGYLVIGAPRTIKLSLSADF
ncbi:TonB-dependent receptor [Paucibacter sp. R3-3]|uniref:TonB-dependent receptor n=1 Tax=Roseateles agri TaxID=3098619 RepID=A0ABU5DKJ3_9BURK|nr:TonB-dependent receptor [Paucibacter sp. R3-3]MDY0746811.1 TonB-dependent receptor [Paucibacter sp. R3-3]